MCVRVQNSRVLCIKDKLHTKKVYLMFVHLGKIERLYNMQYVNFILTGAIKYVLFVKLNMQGLFFIYIYIYIQLLRVKFQG